MIYGQRSRPTAAMRATHTGGPLLVRSEAPALVRAASDESNATMQDNQLCGVPCRMGYPYEIGWGDSEVVFPGAFAEALETFRRKGTILRDHTWRELPIAYPTLIEERVQDGKSVLYGEATYHDHPAAQAARVVAMDRVANGLMVGLSIGFYLEDDGAMWFKDGPSLLTFAKANGYDLGLFDQKAINAVAGWILGVTKIRRLAEYSQCSVLQANDEAYATEARGKATPDPANDNTEPPVDSPSVELSSSPDTEAKRLRDAAIRNLHIAALEALAP